MNNKKVAIIIVNWNGKIFLEDCLNHVYKQTYHNFDVYFVDNGSKDDSVKFVRENFPQIKIIQLDKNTGFARGNNEGIREAFKDDEIAYIVCLNNDTIVENNWLEELVKTVESNENMGAVSSKAYFDDGVTIQTAGLEFCRALQINKKGGISIGFGLTDMEAPELSNDVEIFAPGGVAFLCKREVLKELIKRDGEIFDEDFFAYVEDLDLGFRIRSFGYKCFLSAKSKLIHLHSKTGGVASPFKSYYSERNSILTAIKNLGLVDLLLFPFRNFCLKISYLFNKNKSVEKLKGNVGIWGMILILVKANFSALCLIPKFLIKRWKIMNKKIFLKYFFPIIISLLFLYFLIKIFGGIDINKINSFLETKIILISALIYLAIKIINSFRYNLVFKIRGFFKTIFILFYCNFILSLIPFRIGEISYVTSFKKYYNISSKKSIANLIIIRLFDYFSICFLSAIALLLSLKRGDLIFSDKLFTYPLYAAIIISVILVFLVLFLQKGGAFLEKIRGYVDFSKISKKEIFFASLWSILYWILRFNLGIYLVNAAGINIGYFEIFFISTLMMIVSLIPIQTFAGFGIFEGGWVGALVLFGISKDGLLEKVMAVHVLGLINVITFGFISYTVMLVYNYNKNKKNIYDSSN